MDKRAVRRIARTTCAPIGMYYIHTSHTSKMAIAANRYLVRVLPSGDTTQLMTVLN